MKGYACTTLIKEEALKFMLKDLKKDEEVPVLYEIINLNSNGFDYFVLDEDYSLFS